MSINIKSEEKTAERRLTEPGRDFFCSELVAKAYKCVNIMKPTEEASSNFLPADLTSDKQRLKLIKGAILKREKIILSEGMYRDDEYRMRRASANSQHIEFSHPLIIK